MVDKQAKDACGAHSDIPSGFDYTCDDCMLPYNWKDYDETPEYIKLHGDEDKQERITPHQKFAQTEKIIF